MPPDLAPRAEPTATGLPAVERVRTQARVPGTDRDAVVVRFANGARLRYSRTADGDAVAEAWFPPDAADPAVVNERRDAGASPKAVALDALGAYLTFDDRARAEFVWGERNVAALLGEIEE